MGSFEHLIETGIQPGETMSFSLHEVTPDGIEQTEVAQPVEGFAGGGFYSSIVLLPESVVKTAQPGAMRELLREISPTAPFPSHASETAAQLDHLSGKILHTLVPALTDGAVRTPDSEGYAHLGGPLGYAQVLERVRGRGPTLRDGGQENQLIRDARQQIWESGSEAGLAHAAQVHPRNPFGKPHLWINDEGQVVWLHYLSDASHARSHKINTATLRTALGGNVGDGFAPEDLDEISDRLDLYDALDQEHEQRLAGNSKSFFIADLLEREQISPAQAEKFDESSLAYNAHRLRRLGGLGLKAVTGAIKGSPLKILWDLETQLNTWRMVKDPEYRRTRILESTTLRGLKQANKEGLVSDSDYAEALDVLPGSDMRLYTLLQTGYFVTSRMVDLATVPLAVGAASSSRPLEAGVAVAAFNTLTPGVLRGLSTAVIGRLAKKDLRRMALSSSVPIAGTYLAVPAQIRREYKEKGDEMMHYSLRSIVAGISKIRPHGGWGSDLEEKIWNLGRKESNRPDKIDNLDLPVSTERISRYPGKNFSLS